jgi:hypothetical protein
MTQTQNQINQLPLYVIENMVGTSGFEPLTSTVSKYRAIEFKGVSLYLAALETTGNNP